MESRRIVEDLEAFRKFVMYVKEEIIRMIMPTSGVMKEIMWMCKDKTVSSQLIMWVCFGYNWASISIFI
jgi:hypothetical protein